MNIDYKLLGIRVSTLRHSKKWTQEKLAEKADLSNNYLSNIENNYSIPSLETLMKLCVALDVTPNDLLLGCSFLEKDYLKDDIINLLSQCTPQEKRYIIGFIKVLIDERANKDSINNVAV